MLRLIVITGWMAALAFASGCDLRVDPTSHSFTVRITNDLSHAVIVKQCYQESCSSFYQTAVLKPGATEAAGAVDDGIANPWAVFLLNGRRVGCLPLLYTGMKNDAIVKVSSAERCVDRYRQ